MRFRRLVGSMLLAAAPVLSAAGVASAGRDCVTYSVSAPFLGTPHGTRCTANMPPPFTQAFTDSQCGGIPPANTSFCLTVTIYTP